MRKTYLQVRVYYDFTFAGALTKSLSPHLRDRLETESRELVEKVETNPFESVLLMKRLPGQMKFVKRRQKREKRWPRPSETDID